MAQPTNSPSVKASLLFYSLLLPQPHRQQLQQSLLQGIPETDSLLEGISEIPLSSLVLNARNFIDGFAAMLPNSNIDDVCVLRIIDQLLNPQSCIETILRAQLFASLQTLCSAYFHGFGDWSLAQLIQNGYSAYRCIAPIPSHDFRQEAPSVFGSLITIDCLKDSCDFTETEDSLPMQETTSMPLHKLPQFWKGYKGREEILIKAFYQQLLSADIPLFDPCLCNVERFLSLFEGIPEYANEAPIPVNAAASLEYWGVFLSAIYSGKSGFLMLDGTRIRRSPGNTDELSISGIAMQLIRDQNGNASHSASSFDKGSGNYLDKEARADYDRRCKQALQNALELARSGKESHINSYKLKKSSNS